MRMRLGLRRRLAFLRQRLLQLAQLVVEIGQRAGRVRVLEADRRRASLHLACVQQRGQRLRDVVEDALALILGALDLLPALADAARGARFRIAEHVRMPAHELLVHEPGDRLQIGAAALLQEQREEVDLEQEVAELVGELGVVTPIAASATSYASSTVCGTIVRSVCSRSQGQSRRRRSVSACRSTSASARLNGATASPSSSS